MRVGAAGGEVGVHLGERQPGELLVGGLADVGQVTAEDGRDGVPGGAGDVPAGQREHGVPVGDQGADAGDVLLALGAADQREPAADNGFRPLHAGQQVLVRDGLVDLDDADRDGPPVRQVQGAAAPCPPAAARRRR